MPTRATFRERPPWLARIDRGPAAVGAGVLISPDLVITCAHVVAAALGTGERDSSPPAGEVSLSLVNADGGPVSAIGCVEPGGWIPVADAVERRRLMVWCELGGAVVAAGLTATVLAGRPALPLILLGTAAIAVLGSLYTPASSALLRAAVPADQLGLAMSRMRARGAATQLAGPPLGGALFGLAPALPFAVMAGGLLVSFACLLAVRARSASARADTPMAPRELTAGFRFIWNQPYLRTFLICFGMALNAVFGGVLLVAIMAAA